MSKNQSRSSYTFILSSLLVAIPMMASAQVKTLKTVIDTIIFYLNSFLVLLIGVAVVIFVWHVIKYFIMPNEDRKNAGLYVMYSLIGFFVLLSFWGLVNILQNTFNLKNENNQPSSWTSFKGLFPGGSNLNSGTTGGVSPMNSGTTGGRSSGNDWSIPDSNGFDARGQEQSNNNWSVPDANGFDARGYEP